MPAPTRELSTPKSLCHSIQHHAQQTFTQVSGFSAFTTLKRCPDSLPLHLLPLQGEPSGDLYALKPGMHIPAEGDLRKLLTPDMWCAYESMAVGQARLKETGLKHIPTLAQIHPDHLRLAYDQLPPSSVRCFTCPTATAW